MIYNDHHDHRRHHHHHPKFIQICCNHSESKTLKEAATSSVRKVEGCCGLGANWNGIDVP